MKFKNKIIYAVLIILLINTNYVFAEKSDSIKNEIEDNKNTLDRCFNLFSAYDKRYYYDDNNLILNIYYHDFDEAEIVRDILSLGKSVIVLEPKKIRDKVVNRILRNFDRQV